MPSIAQAAAEPEYRLLNENGKKRRRGHDAVGKDYRYEAPCCNLSPSDIWVRREDRC